MLCDQTVTAPLRRRGSRPYRMSAAATGRSGRPGQSGNRPTCGHIKASPRSLPLHQRLPPNLDELFPPSPENVRASIAIQAQFRGMEARRVSENLREETSKRKKLGGSMSLVDNAISAKTAKEAHYRSRHLIDPRRSKRMAYW